MAPCHHVGTTVHVAVEGKYIGHIVISDEVKPDAKEAIAALKAQGVKKTVMLTGDRDQVAQQVAGALGVDQVYSQLLPADKVEKVEQLLGEFMPTTTSISRTRPRPTPACLRLWSG